jgi:hypothetical protein
MATDITSFTIKSDKQEVIDNLKTSFVLGKQAVLKGNETDKDRVYSLAKLPLTKYISSDLSPENAKIIVGQIRETADRLTTRLNEVNDLLPRITKITKKDVAEANLTLNADNPISYSEAISQITGTFVSKSEFLKMMNEVFTEFWAEAADLINSAFSQSMYARQYTGSMIGLNPENRAFSEISIHENE